MDSPNDLDPDTVFWDNKEAPSLKGRNYMKIGDMLTLKHDIISQNTMNYSPIND